MTCSSFASAACTLSTSLSSITRGLVKSSVVAFDPIALSLTVEPKQLIPSLQEIQIPVEEIDDRIKHINEQVDLDQAEKDSLAQLLKNSKRP